MRINVCVMYAIINSTYEGFSTSAIKVHGSHDYEAFHFVMVMNDVRHAETASDREPQHLVKEHSLCTVYETS